NLVGVVRTEQIEALAADVADLQRRVARDLTLHGDVPLPVVAHPSGGIEPVLRDALVGGERVRERLRVAVEGAAAEHGAVERRVEAEVQAVLERLALIELAEAHADRGLAVAVDVPGEAEAGGNVTLGLRQ